MADILIKGMEMPTSCTNCKFAEFWEGNPWTYGYRCWITRKDITKDIGEKTFADGCPLKEVNV